MKKLDVRGNAAHRRAQDQLAASFDFDADVLGEKSHHRRGHSQTIGRAVDFHRNRVHVGARFHAAEQYRKKWPGIRDCRGTRASLACVVTSNTVDLAEMARLSGREARARMRAGLWRRPTAGVAPGWVQANLVVLPTAFADSFGEFCARNPRPCPLLETTEAGSPEPRRIAPGSDLRTDVPRYRIYRNGALETEVDSLSDVWEQDFVSFLLGCSFSFEAALARAGIPLRHVELGCNCAMYRTNQQCEPAGPFHGPLVVSMRPIPDNLLAETARITSRFPHAHGAPIHVGEPSALGIVDLDQPDYGDPLPVRPGETPVFWACGVTPQAAAEAARLPLMITHAPGHMFITDLRDDSSVP
jgi:uncharacterized protein YcsI (UPF0317 family)